MEFTFEFIRMFAVGLFYSAPLLIALMLIIAVLGHFIGKMEGWSKLDALYHCFITATTVGYGDFHPSKKTAKIPRSHNCICRSCFHRDRGCTCN